MRMTHLLCGTSSEMPTRVAICAPFVAASAVTQHTTSHKLHPAPLKCLYRRGASSLHTNRDQIDERRQEGRRLLGVALHRLVPSKARARRITVQSQFGLSCAPNSRMSSLLFVQKCVHGRSAPCSNR